MAQTIEQAKFLNRREMTREVVEAFKEYFEGYVPVKTSSRFWEVHIHFLRGLGRAYDESGEHHTELFSELAEDLTRLQRLFAFLDEYLLPPPNSYVENQLSIAAKSQSAKSKRKRRK